MNCCRSTNTFKRRNVHLVTRSHVLGEQSFSVDVYDAFIE